uniref:Uncharacterized protein n=1 Tax=Salmo trutta TaxID=8032 RepID=A0A674AVQ1_SALTR
MCLLSVTGTVRLSLFYLQEETEPNYLQLKPADLNKNSKGSVPEIRQKLKKESKKKRYVSLSNSDLLYKYEVSKNKYNCTFFIFQFLIPPYTVPLESIHTP